MKILKIFEELNYKPELEISISNGDIGIRIKCLVDIN